MVCLWYLHFFYFLANFIFLKNNFKKYYMKKFISTNLFMLSLNIQAQNSEDSFRNIEPPPTPIDSFILPSIVLAVLIFWIFHYRLTNKSKINENK